MIAAAEKTIISVVALEVFASGFVGCFGSDDGAIACAGDDEGSEAGTLAAFAATGFGNEGVVGTFFGDSMLVRLLIGGAVGGGTLVGALAVGTSSDGIGRGEA